jgi:hypothetical protein
MVKIKPNTREIKYALVTKYRLAVQDGVQRPDLMLLELNLRVLQPEIL